MTWVRLGDGTVARILVRGRRCKWCKATARWQCDARVIRRGKRAICDVHLCMKCATKLSVDVDLCPAHARLLSPEARAALVGDPLEDCMCGVPLCTLHTAGGEDRDEPDGGEAANARAAARIGASDDDHVEDFLGHYPGDS